MRFEHDNPLIKSLPRFGRDLWVKVANAYYDEHPDEALAKSVAWNAVRAAGFAKEETEHKWSLSGTKESVLALEKAIHPFGGVPVSFQKAYTAADKSRHVVVKASGLKVDRQNERMAPSAIDDMVKSSIAGKVELLDNHYSSFEMGKSTDASTNEAGEMFIDFQLNENHPNNDQLYDECAKGICKRQASVGGNVTEAHYEYNDTLGKAIKVLDHVDLDHTAVTREGHSAYPDAEFVGAIMKQVHLPVPDFKKGGGTMKEFLEQLSKLAIQAESLMKGFFQVTPEMLDGSYTLKAQYREQMEKSVPVLTPEEKEVVSKSLESILKAVGVPTVLKEKKTKEEEDAEAEKKKKDAEETEKRNKEAAGNTEKNLAEAANALVKTLRDDLELKLKKAQEEYETLKKETHVTAKDLTKSLLEVQELKKDLAKLSKQPVAPRPGSGIALTKNDEVDVNAVEAILKTVMADPDGFMSKLEDQVNQMVKQKGTRSWTPELEKEAQQKAQLLKDCKTMGAAAAMEKHGIKAQA